MSKGWTILLVGFMAMAALLVLFCWSLYRLAIHRNRKAFLSTDRNMPQVDDSTLRDVKEWFRSQSFEEADIVSDDGLPLKAHYLSPERESRDAVILAHGYSGKGEDMAVFARYYREHGFHVLMPDNRGHGRSGGHYIGFGWHDRKDYVRWAEYLVRRLGDEVRIVLHGVSMGGGTVLMTSGEALPPQVKCLISDCAYTSVSGILAYQLKMMFKLPAFPLLPITSLICKLRAGYFFGEASALRQLRNCCKPILLIHGGKDTFVPTWMADELFAAIRGEKEKLIVPEARHGTSILVDPAGYLASVNRFVQAAFGGQARRA
ncbi:alpha/beta hydrolase [Cohnella fermenti]|uniref:Alpha/beta hydrolase n=1 Tax=Cohnella fermenti TaxID=2565925 RepID=A0A4S4CDU2_9BACL|nr:alpha/beta hydrolase [Cohnella fermenti]THF84148.1 alpha/beta hydrolase [Cohnella fermenti]